MLFLQVTDELFNEIATRVLSEEDLTVDGWCLPFSNPFLFRFLLCVYTQVIYIETKLIFFLP